MFQKKKKHRATICNSVFHRGVCVAAEGKFQFLQLALSLQFKSQAVCSACCVCAL